MVVAHVAEGQEAVEHLVEGDEQPRLPDAGHLAVARPVPVVAGERLRQQVGEAHAVGTALEVGGLPLALG